MLDAHACSLSDDAGSCTVDVLPNGFSDDAGGCIVTVRPNGVAFSPSGSSCCEPGGYAEPGYAELARVRVRGKVWMECASSVGWSCFLNSEGSMTARSMATGRPLEE